MKNFAIVSLLLVCFLVVSVTARSYAVVELAHPGVSAAMNAGSRYEVVANADYAPGKFRCNRHVFKFLSINRLELLHSLASVVYPFCNCLH